MLKIEFDPSNTALALAIGKALTEYAGGETNDRTHCAATVEQITAAEVNAGNLPKSVDTAKGPSPSAQSPTLEPAFAQEPASTARPSVDEKGVVFLPAICGQAAEPFYSTGTNKGQWKKLRGVDQAEYDRVYASALASKPVTQAVGQQVQAETTLLVTQQTHTPDQTVATASPAAEVFAATQNPIDETISEIPVTPQEVFTLYSEICAGGGVGVANAICEAAGISNGTLIFSRPDLAPRLFRELTTQKAALVGGA